MPSPGAGGATLQTSELGGAVSGVPLLQGADPASWGLQQGLGDPILSAADMALKTKGIDGGLAGQGIDTNQITGPLNFQGVMPQQAASLSAPVTEITGMMSLAGLK